MKSAEEWRLIWLEETHTPWPEIVKRAQVDALRHAAQIANVAGCIRCQDTYHNIVLEADRLESKGVK